MKLYTKILLITTPLIFLAGLVNGGVAWHLARNSQLEISRAWLERRMEDSLHITQKAYDEVSALPNTDSAVVDAQQQVAASLMDLVIYEEGSLFVMEQNGGVIIYNGPPATSALALPGGVQDELWVATMLEDPDGGTLDFKLDGETLTGVYRQFEPWGWTIVVCAPQSNILAPINLVRNLATLINLGGLVIITLLLAFLIRRFSTPMELMAVGAAEMGRGNYKIRIPVRSQDEIGGLAKAFNQMAVQVESSMTALAKSEKHYRALIENITDIIAIMNIEGQVVYVSPSLTRMLGYKPYEIIGKQVYEFIHPDDLKRASHALELIAAGRGSVSPQEIRIRHRNGTWQDCDAKAINLLDEPTVSGLVITLRDIRERKQAEIMKTSIYEISEAAFQAQTLEELFKSVHRIISQLIPATNFYVALYNPDQQILTFPYFVDEFEKAPPPAELGRGLTEYVLRTGQALLVDPAKFSEMVSRGEVDDIGAPSIDWLGIPLISNARTIGVLVVQSYNEAVRFGEREKEILSFVSVQAAMAVVRKQAEDAIRNSEMRYRELFENSPVSLWEEDFTGIYSRIEALQKEGVTDFRTYFYSHPEVVREWAGAIRVLDVNQATLDLYGANTKIELTSNLGQIMGLKAVPILTEELIAMAEGATGFTSNAVNYTMDGKELDLILSWKMSAGPSRIIICILDMTGQRRAEEEVKAQLQRMNALRAIDMSITASLDLRSTLSVLLDQVSQQLKVDAAAVLLLDPQTLTLEYAASRGFKTNALRNTHLRLGEGFAGRAALERTLERNLNLLHNPGTLSQSRALTEEGFIAYFAAPLVAKGQVKGVLEIFHRDPLDPPQEWIDFLETLARQAAIAIDNATLFNDLQRSNVELTLAYDATIEGWSRALDLRDKETEGHTQRVSEMTLRLAMMLGVAKSDLVHYRWGALLHDIGKMGIPDSILHKPGSLDKHETAVMQQHPVYAYEMLLPIAYLRPALDIPYYHHERWDGTGYPCQLKGEAIPLPARIFSIVDVWDALRSDRPYRSAWTDLEVWEYIRSESGKHFDPKVVDAFVKMIDSEDGMPNSGPEAA